jgi:hypothetical protein
MVTAAGSPRRPPLTQGATSPAFYCPPALKARVGRLVIIKCSASADAGEGQKQASDEEAAGDGRVHRQAVGGRGRPLRSRGQGEVIPQTPRAVICRFASSRLSARAPRFHAGHWVFHLRHAQKLGFVPRSGTSCGPHPRPHRIPRHCSS